MGSINDDTIILTASPSRFAGAISSLIFRGVEYVDIADHGRQIQSAIQLDGAGECYNSNETSSKADGNSQYSSSILNYINTYNSVLITSTRPAFWLAPGEICGKPCSPSSSATSAQNDTVLWNYTIARQNKFYGSAIPNLIDMSVSFTVPENRSTASVEALTGYLPSTFNIFLTWDRVNRVLTRLNATTGLQAIQAPVIIAKANGASSMGVISSTIDGSNPAQAYYAYFSFPGSAPTSKWACVFGASNLTAGTVLNYSCPIAVGNVEVISALSSYPASGPTPTSMVPLYRFFNGKHPMTLSYAEGAGAGWTFETTGFHLFPGGGPGYAAIYRCHRSANLDHFLSTSSNGEGFSVIGVVGYASMGPASGLVPLYRFYKSSTKDYLQTVNLNEGTDNGYTNEGLLGYVTY